MTVMRYREMLERSQQQAAKEASDAFPKIRAFRDAWEAKYRERVVQLYIDQVGPLSYAEVTELPDTRG